VDIRDNNGSVDVVNGWVDPIYRNQEDYLKFEAGREQSEYSAYFIQGGIFVVSMFAIVEIRGRRIRDALRKRRTKPKPEPERSSFEEFSERHLS
jgi:hypothetical protein